MTEISLQLVTERMLLSALRDQDAATAADEARDRAQFLADASLRFGASLDQEITYSAIAEIALPGPGAWCIVDIVEATGKLRRLAVVHPDADKQEAARQLVARWTPAPQDPIGVPAVMQDRRPVIIPDSADAAVAAAARDPETLRVLRSLSPGPLLVVPIVAHSELLGAITFVSAPGAPPYALGDIRLAEALAERCGQALESAHLYAAARASRMEAEAARADAEIARAVAEDANSTKAKFLSTMSHELRTPLNAIGGYAQLMELGVRGPITPEQRTDLASIQRSQAHLLGLVDAVLNYAQIGAGRAVYATADILLVDVVHSVETFVIPQMKTKKLEHSFSPCSLPLSVSADAGKVRQIVLNLIGNAIKFTPEGGCITIDCVEPSPEVRSQGGRRMLAVRVTDTGLGIPAHSINTIFDPFVQIDRRLSSQGVGVGLGLAISRDLARGMGGDITVESTPNVGSTFTLLLPEA